MSVISRHKQIAGSLIIDEYIDKTLTEECNYVYICGDRNEKENDIIYDAYYYK